MKERRPRREEATLGHLGDGSPAAATFLPNVHSLRAMAIFFVVAGHCLESGDTARVLVTSALTGFIWAIAKEVPAPPT